MHTMQVMWHIIALENNILFDSSPSQTSPLSSSGTSLEQYSHTVATLNCRGKNLCPLWTWKIPKPHTNDPHSTFCHKLSLRVCHHTIYNLQHLIRLTFGCGSFPEGVFLLRADGLILAEYLFARLMGNIASQCNYTQLYVLYWWCIPCFAELV